MDGSAALPQTNEETPLFPHPELNEERHTKPDWASFSGKVLEGGYEVEELLEAERDRAKYKVRVLGGGGIGAIVDVFRADGAAGSGQVELWETARKLEHANLSTPLAAGQTQLDDVNLIYVILRRPDETLDLALRERALNAGEAREVLLSVSHALERLHREVLVHGCVAPAQILAVNDSIQLSTECVRSVGSAPGLETAKPKYVAPESAGVNVTPAADVWCLGATLFECLTQKECGADWREAADRLAAPFSRIIERCLEPDPETRCGLAEIDELYKQKQDSPPRLQRGAGAVPELARIPHGGEPIRTEITRAPEIKAGAEAARESGRRPAGADNLRAQSKTPQSKTWIYAAVGVVIVLLVIWAARPKQRPAAKATAANVTARSGAPPASGAAWETRTLAPEGSSVKPQPKAQPARVDAVPRRDLVTRRPELATINGPVWRVVLFTYDHQEDAENRTHLLNGKHPDLAAEVFSPNGPDGPYLVTAGGGMSREDAVRLRQKALRLGMPSDSYIQNYKQ